VTGFAREQQALNHAALYRNFIFGISGAGQRVLRF
jgi:hypothetical protein